MQISSSGFVTFGGTEAYSWPALLSTLQPTIAPYWMTMDLCRVKYEWHDNSSPLMPRIVNLTGNDDLQTALVVTWANCVPAPWQVFGQQNITFQLALATDLLQLHALFAYPYGKSHLNKFSKYPTQVGFYDGSTRTVVVSMNWLGTNALNLNQAYNLDQQRGNTGEIIYYEFMIYELTYTFYILCSMYGLIDGLWEVPI